MTVPANTNKVQTAGNGSTTAFPLGANFIFFNSSELQVYVRVDSTGVSTLQVEGVDYTVSGGSGSTGTVNMTVAPASGETLTTVRRMPLTQLADLVNNDPQDAEVVEDMVDKNTLSIQEYDELQTRTLRSPVDESVDMELPSSVARKDKFLKFTNTADATPTAVDVITGGTELNSILSAYNDISASAAADKLAYATGSSSGALADFTAYARTLVDDADAATARTTLEVPKVAASPVAGNVAEHDGSGNLVDSGFSAEDLKSGRKSILINADFDIWQRGTNFTGTGLSADRWTTVPSGTTHVTTRELFTLGQTDVPDDPKYFMQTVTTAGAGTADLYILQQKIEGVERFNGQQITLSFWAKSNAGSDISAEIVQFFGTGGSPSANVNTTLGKITTTTSWAQYTLTGTFPSISGKTLGTNGNDNIQFLIWLDAGSDYDSRTVSLGHQSDTFALSHFQIEKGDMVTDFEKRLLATEQADCHRYFQRLPADNGVGSPFAAVAAGTTLSTTTIRTYVSHLATMRAAPTASFANLLIFTPASSTAVTSISNAFTGTRSSMIDFDDVTASLTAGQSGVVYRNNNTSGYIDLDAEL